MGRVIFLVFVIGGSVTCASYELILGTRFQDPNNTHNTHLTVQQIFCINKIAMCVSFRKKRPWEGNNYGLLTISFFGSVELIFFILSVFSGGIDSLLIRWDFSRGTPIETFDMSKIQLLNSNLNLNLFLILFNSIFPTFSYQDSLSMGNQSQSSSSSLVNPPFVNSVDISNDGNIVVAGLGSGELQFLVTRPKLRVKGNKKGNTNSKNQTVEWQSRKLYDAHSSAVIRV